MMSFINVNIVIRKFQNKKSVNCNGELMKSLKTPVRVLLSVFVLLSNLSLADDRYKKILSSFYADAPFECDEIAEYLDDNKISINGEIQLLSRLPTLLM